MNFNEDIGYLPVNERNCELRPNGLNQFRGVRILLDAARHCFEYLDCESESDNRVSSMESVLRYSKENCLPPEKITTIKCGWKRKEDDSEHRLYLKWLPPQSTNLEIERYHIDVDGSVSETRDNKTELEMELLDLTATEYKVRIQAENRFYKGPFSEWVVAKELKPPPAPPEKLYCIERHYSYLTIEWVYDVKPDDIEFFTLEMKSGECCYPEPMEFFREERDLLKIPSFKPVYSGEHLSYKVDDLVPDTEYEFRICASNFARQAGSYSGIFKVSTCHLVPRDVRTFRFLTMMEISKRKKEKMRKLRAKKLPLGRKKYPPLALKLLSKAIKHLPSPRKHPLKIRKRKKKSRSGSDEEVENAAHPPARAIITSAAVQKCDLCDSEEKRIHEFNTRKVRVHTRKKKKVRISNRSIKFKRDFKNLDYQLKIPKIILDRVRSVDVIPFLEGLHIKWSGPVQTCYDRCFYSYNVVLSNLSFNTNDNVKEIVVKGLDPDTSYSIHIQAVCCDGPGPSSKVILTKTRPALPEPPQMQCLEANCNNLRLFFYHKERKDIISYGLQMLKSESFELVYHGKRSTCRAMLLEENTEYQFRVCAFSPDGQGQYSDVYKFKTSSSDAESSSSKVVDQADPSAVKIDQVTSASKVMVQSATAFEVLEQTASAFELIGQTAAASEIMEQVCSPP